MNNYDIAVIGGGPADITLAKMLGKKMKVAVIRPEDYSMIYCAMPYAIENIIDVEKTLKNDDLVTGSGAKLIRKHVSRIDTASKKLVFSDSTEIGWQKLVIASGAEPVMPPVRGIDLYGVTGFKTEKDLRKIKKFIDESGVRKAVVVGAGAIGIEIAQALSTSGLKVDIADLGSSILPNLLDSEMTTELLEEIKQKGIKVHLGAKVTGIEGKEWVEEVVLDNGETIEFEPVKDSLNSREKPAYDGIVVFAVGMKPSVGIVEGTGIETGRGGILVNDRMETNIEGVYAAGDCVQFTSGITGRVTPGKLATNAVPMAKVLGYNLLGKERRYSGFYNGAATRVGKYYAGGCGLTERAAASESIETVTGYSELTAKFPIMPEAGIMKTKLIADKKTGKIIGGQIVSTEPVTGRIDLLTFAIQKNSTVEELAELSYSSQPYQSYYPAANSIVLAAESILSRL